MARIAGLTEKQYTCYSRWYAGATQREIGDQLGMRQSRVSECIARALSRHPDLPRPKRGRYRRLNVATQSIAA